MLPQTLFKSILIHRILPNKFGIGVIIPSIKNKCGNINDANNLRAIILSPIIVKVFEMVQFYVNAVSFIYNLLGRR